MGRLQVLAAHRFTAGFRKVLRMEGFAVLPKLVFASASSDDGILQAPLTTLCIENYVKLSEAATENMQELEPHVLSIALPVSIDYRKEKIDCLRDGVQKVRRVMVTRWSGCGQLPMRFEVRDDGSVWRYCTDCEDIHVDDPLRQQVTGTHEHRRSRSATDGTIHHGIHTHEVSRNNLLTCSWLKWNDCRTSFENKSTQIVCSFITVL